MDNTELLDQGTAEWKDARAGHVTASRIADVMAKPKSKGQAESTTRANYKAQLVCEILSGKATTDEFQSWHTRRGNELEPNARIEYELKSGFNISTVGFVKHPTIARAGASPDAIVDADGLAQFKCPIPAIHMEYVFGQIVPVEYRKQMYFEMACTGKAWNDFVSYCPQVIGHELFIKRLVRDDAEIAIIEEAVRQFNAEVDEMIARLKGIQ